MSWDLALSDKGDAIVTANGDLAGKSGTDLLEQRMLIRLRLHRGAWPYDESQSLGSNLYQLIGMESSKVAEIAPAYVRDALRPIDEIVVDDVEVIATDHSVSLNVRYRVHDATGETINQSDEQFQLTIPLLGGGA